MLTDEDIRDVTEAFVQIANKDGTINDVMKEYQDKRSMAIKISGSRFKTGFIFKDGKLRMLSDIDKPTVTVTMDKEIYWKIINAESSGLAKAMIYTAIFTEESIIVDPPPGVSGGALHIENVIKVFNSISKNVMG